MLVGERIFAAANRKTSRGRSKCGQPISGVIFGRVGVISNRYVIITCSFNERVFNVPPTRRGLLVTPETEQNITRVRYDNCTRDDV